MLENIIEEKESKIAGYNFGLFTADWVCEDKDHNRRHYCGWAIQYGGIFNLFHTFNDLGLAK